MPAQIVTLMPPKSSTAPTRSRVATIRTHPAFLPLASWLAAFLPRPFSHPPMVVKLDELDAVVRDRVVEEATRAASSLDEAAAAVARLRGRKIAVLMCDQLAMAVRGGDDAIVSERAVQIADAVIDTYRHHLAYGAATTEAQS